MRVFASHLPVRRATVDTASDTVLEAAKRVAAGRITPEIETMRLQLETATGVPLDELAKHVQAWPV